ncbi:MAG: hypothetical protein NC302_00540 [Bacteroidales bacterium]|nr:hypothetical protein [Bacteroidales bacterium]MCM1422264.1 hypothetical protein [bacterium]
MDLCHRMTRIAISSCKTEEEKNAVKEMTLEKLHDFGLLCRVGKEFYPTHAFDLLTENRDRFARVQCAVFKGTVRDIFIDKKEFDGPIYEQIEAAHQFVLRHINLGVEIEGIYRSESYELPPSAIREMIANAVVHRSYLQKTCIQVCVFDDRVEVISPGMLYDGVDLETAKRGKSICRNKAIAEAFHYMQIVEAWGTGIPRIISRCREYGLSEPIFDEYGDGFIAVLFRKTENISEKMRDATLEESYPVRSEQDDEQDIMEAIIAFCSEPRSVKEIVKEFAFPNRLYLRRHYLDKMLRNKELKMTLPDKPSSKNQKYYS